MCSPIPLLKGILMTIVVIAFECLFVASSIRKPASMVQKLLIHVGCLQHVGIGLSAERHGNHDSEEGINT